MINSRKYSKSSFGLVMFLLMPVMAMSSAQPATFTVTKTADANNAICDADCSLRQAIGAVNIATTDDIIELDRDFFSAPRVITLTNGGLSIADN